MIEMHKEAEQLGAYALGALDEREAAELAAHLAGCATCRRELAELESVRDLLGELPPEAMLDGPPDDGDLLLQRTLRQVRSETRGYARRRPLLAAAAAVAAVALLGGGVLLGQRFTAPVVQPTVTVTPTPAPSTPVQGTRSATATDPRTGATLTATVVPAAGWVRTLVVVNGIPAGEDCQVIVVAKDGRRRSASEWKVSEAGERDGTTLPGAAIVAPADVAAVEIVNLDGRVFVRAPIA